MRGNVAKRVMGRPPSPADERIARLRGSWRNGGILQHYPFSPFVSHLASHLSAAASVGASASQRCPPDTRALIRGRLNIYSKPQKPPLVRGGVSLSADGGVVRGKSKFCSLSLSLPQSRSRSTALGCRLGRRFCFAEVSTGHPRPRQREAKYIQQTPKASPCQGRCQPFG